MRGEIIIVRAYGDKPLIRRIWTIGKNVIYITNDEQFQLLTEGKKALEPIGFPVEDVFKYDPEIAKSINKRCDWHKLKLWKD